MNDSLAMFHPADIAGKLANFRPGAHTDDPSRRMLAFSRYLLRNWYPTLNTYDNKRFSSSLLVALMSVAPLSVLNAGSDCLPVINSALIFAFCASYTATAF